MRALDVQNLHTEIRTPDGTIPLLKGVEFFIDEGEMVGLVGESGCGKSMTARAIMRLLPGGAQITQGSVLLQGHTELASASPSILSTVRGVSISMVFQDPMTYLNPLMKNADQIAEPLRVHLGHDKDTAHKVAVDLLKSVGIGDAERIGKEYPHQLSGGMRQRVTIAIALACNPSVLIADEPFTALDLSVQQQLVTLLKKKQIELNLAMLLITHDLALATEVCDRLYIMYAGEVVESGSIDQIYNAPRHPYTEALLACARLHERAEKHRIPFIPGDVPSFLELPPGCRFHPRCPHRFSPCDNREPPNTRFNSSDGWAKCWLHVEDDSE